MDPQMTQIFAPLKAAIEAQPLDLADLMELIGGFSSTSPEIAQAMCFHARDIDIEERVVGSYQTLISEVYWRTFFDRKCATKYGTNEMLDQGPGVLTDFVKYMIDSVTMDAVQDSHGSSHPAPSESH